jgi:hypothetical protein
MRQKLKYQDVQDFCSWFLLPRRAHSELCNQSGGEKHGQKEKRDWYFNKCLIPNTADEFGLFWRAWCDGNPMAQINTESIRLLWSQSVQ